MVSIKDRLNLLWERIEKTCDRLGRSPSEIKLVAISKTFPPEAIREVVLLGIKSIGENRVQEALLKREALRDLDIEWHMVGYLQRNKVKKALQIFDFIQSLDRLSLAEEINREAEKLGIKKVKVLVEVNISGEPTKHGVSPDRLFEFLESIESFKRIDVRGLMTVGPLTDDLKRIREAFMKMRRLYEEAKRNFAHLSLDYLSMGMTDDFEIAIEEGSNMLRIGRAIFGPRSDR